ncbi:hypothetical protein HZH68_009784 [Vespula germanica]|uniref:Uncharacterized protein n=1 Tax=Vespula germanica TaxID=30212 RepID=A0A834N5H6_VESGE|nr:hypothetical protein HZH68_009784 [Vespula germanica]
MRSLQADTSDYLQSSIRIFIVFQIRHSHAAVLDIKYEVRICSSLMRDISMPTPYWNWVGLELAQSTKVRTVIRPFQ